MKTSQDKEKEDITVLGTWIHRNTVHSEQTQIEAYAIQVQKIQEDYKFQL